MTQRFTGPKGFDIRVTQDTTDFHDSFGRVTRQVKRGESQVEIQFYGNSLALDRDMMTGDYFVQCRHPNGQVLLAEKLSSDQFHQARHHAMANISPNSSDGWRMSLGGTENFLVDWAIRNQREIHTSEHKMNERSHQWDADRYLSPKRFREEYQAEFSPFPETAEQRERVKRAAAKVAQARKQAQLEAIPGFGSF